MLNRKLQSASSGISFADGAWDLSYAYYDDPKAWDLSTANGVETLLISGKETEPNGIFFHPDGTRFYIIGTNSDSVHEYARVNSSAPAWFVRNFVFVRSFSVSAQEVTPRDLFFSSDGTKMYVLGDSGDDVNEYSLSTAWDISTASYVQVFSVAGQETTPTGLFFKPDGTKMYISGDTGNDINEYSLSTAWNVSTASYVQNFSVNAQDSSPRAVFFKPDGTKMYVAGDANNNFYEYSLSTAWDISSASYVRSTPSGNVSPQGIFIRQDGGGFYDIDPTSDRITQYSLGGFSVRAQDTAPYGMFFKPDGTKMYISGDTGNDINEYSLSTAWDTSTATFVQAKVIGDTAPRNLFFKPDGTVMLVVGINSDAVYIYSLSTAWDISTATLTATRSISAQETNASGIFFKPDGTKVYICGLTGNNVHEYDVSPAWTGTFTFVQSRGVERDPSGIFFRPDGKRMYIVRYYAKDDEVLEYHLSTPWNISSAGGSPNQRFFIGNEAQFPTGLSFSDEGTKMFALDFYGRVFTYTLAPQP